MDFFGTKIGGRAVSGGFLDHVYGVFQLTSGDLEKRWAKVRLLGKLDGRTDTSMFVRARLPDLTFIKYALRYSRVKIHFFIFVFILPQIQMHYGHRATRIGNKQLIPTQSKPVHPRTIFNQIPVVCLQLGSGLQRCLDIH